LNLKKPTRFCDLLALVNIAFYIMHKEVPSTMAANLIAKENPGILQGEEFAKFRRQHRKQFDKALCKQNFPFHTLSKHIINLRNAAESECYKQESKKII
jgi:hypothetical protein